MIEVGQRLPEVTLFDCPDVSGEGCSIGPTPFELTSALAEKRIVIFALPGAFTPTCSEQHVPGFLSRAPEFKALGIDGVWCVSVNDPFVMGAWGKSLAVGGRLRMVADGSAALTRAVGLSLDLSSKGLGIRSQRYSMLVVDGTLAIINVDEGGKLVKSGAGTLLDQIMRLS